MCLVSFLELTENEVMFYSVESVLGQFLDVDHLLSLCIKIPKNDNMKTAESKITKVIHLKHTLELVSTLLEAIKFSESELLVAYATILQDNRLRQMHEKISLVLHDDTQYEKCSLNMKTQRCFAVRSGMNEIYWT
ncbi:MutS protein homolog 4 [Geodia barretti]|uniref:MutS protein homolog 4 n=1 Tax=Geodia barretti TaxID=519541 RepID=A0AA35T7A4_GEOBA|nr:MutS protein homolog 4 [Geodia barretti]